MGLIRVGLTRLLFRTGSAASEDSSANVAAASNAYRISMVKVCALGSLQDVGSGVWQLEWLVLTVSLPRSRPGLLFMLRVRHPIVRAEGAELRPGLRVQH